MRIRILFLFCWLAATVNAQQPDTLAPQPDTLPAAAVATVQGKTGKEGLLYRVFTKDYPNPKTAAFMSLVLPGSGQVYNRKWWKLPLVYAAIGTTSYIFVKNLQEYKRLRDSYRLLVDGDPTTNPTEVPYSLLDATSTKKYRDIYNVYVEQSAIAVGLAYVLTATEAFVDAHLTHFDVSDDLSLRVLPKAQATPANGLAYGLGVTLQFGAARPKPTGVLP